MSQRTCLSLFLLGLLAAACSSAPGAAGSGRQAATEDLFSLPIAGSKALVAARAAWTHADAPSSDDVTDAEAATGTAATYPAFSPDVPEIVSSGGPTLHRPKLVTVTWDGDPRRATYEALGSQVGTSSYWGLLSEWGIGVAQDGGNVHVAAPFTLTYETFDAWLEEQVAGAPKNGWPEWTPETVYAVYVPASAGFTAGGQPFCDTYGTGVHDATPAADGGASLVYALTMACASDVVTDDFTVSIATIDLAGAVTNPYPTTQPAYQLFDSAHAAWDVYTGMNAEVALSAWTFWEGITEIAPPMTMAVSRFWSGHSAAAGHDPLVPRDPQGTYFNTTTFARDLSNVTVDLSATGKAGKLNTKGVQVALGKSKTFDVGFFSDGPTSPWTLSAVVQPVLPIYDAAGNPLPNGDVDVTIDQPTGANGHVAHVTVTPRSASAAIGAEYIELQSGYADFYAPHTLPILVGQ